MSQVRSVPIVNLAKPSERESEKTSQGCKPSECTICALVEINLNNDFIECAYTQHGTAVQLASLNTQMESDDF